MSKSRFRIFLTGFAWKSGTPQRSGGALRGPAAAVVEVRRPRPERIRISGWLCPGGGEVRPPSVADPHWRGPDGRAHRLFELLAGQSPEMRRRLLEEHAEAIAHEVRAAAAAKASQRPGAARPLVAAVTRLCNELIGHA